MLYSATPPAVDPPPGLSFLTNLVGDKEGERERTIQDWTSRIDKDTKVKRNTRMFAAWLACDTEDEIAVSEKLTIFSGPRR